MKCRGCGAELQHEHEDQIGYVPKVGAEYCQRCFRLMHYDDLNISMKTGIDPYEVFRRIAEMDCLVLWVVDLFDFEASMIEGINRHLGDKDIVMVATKRDVFPQTLSQEKIASFIFRRLKELGITIKGLVVTGKNIREGQDEVMRAVELMSKGRKVVVMGKANAGKSTLLNGLMAKDVLTMSSYPGTTIDFNELEIGGYTFVDTPGIEGKKTMVMLVKEQDIKKILPYKRMKPMVYQCRRNQCFSIGGLAQVSLMECDNASAVFYMSNEVLIHRGKAENADALWEKHYGEMFVPTCETEGFRTVKINKKYDKMDIVIDGLGWICVSGQLSEIVVRAPKEVNVTFRKALL